MESDPFCNSFSSEEKVFVESSDGSDIIESPRISSKRKNRITYPWSDEETIKLIYIVKAYACIWNFKSNAHRHPAKRGKAWRAIAAHFKNRISVEQLSTKWQNLRRALRKTLLDASKTQSGQFAIRPPDWKFYPYMAFVNATEQQSNVSSELTAISIQNRMKLIFFHNSVAVERVNGR